MSYIQNTAFKARVSNNIRDGLANITGKFQNDSNADEACSAGFLCVTGARLGNEGYTGVYNDNSFIMNAAVSTTNAATPVYAADTHDVNMVEDPVTHVIRKVGSNTLGLPIPKGMNGTFCEIVFDGKHEYRFGIGNVNGTIGTKTLFTIGDGLLVPIADANIPTDNGSLYFKLVKEGTFTQGAYAGFGYVDVVAKTVVA